MELRALPSSAPSEQLISCILPRYIKIKNICKLNLEEKAAAMRRSFDQLLRFNLRCSANGDSATVSASNAHGMELSFSNIPPHDARILYSVAPSMGHNKENHPESNLRVPAIVNALEGFELTSKYRGLEVFEMQNFPPASVDDIARVHARAYVAGLEKAMSKATDEGIIFIDGSGPTYATETTFQESLIAAGAGLSLVDSVLAQVYKIAVKIKLCGLAPASSVSILFVKTIQKDAFSFFFFSSRISDKEKPPEFLCFAVFHTLEQFFLLSISSLYYSQTHGQPFARVCSLNLLYANAQGCYETNQWNEKDDAFVAAVLAFSEDSSSFNLEPISRDSASYASFNI